MLSKHKSLFPLLIKSQLNILKDSTFTKNPTLTSKYGGHLIIQFTPQRHAAVLNAWKYPATTGLGLSLIQRNKK